MAVFLFMCACGCVCSEWKRSLQSSSPFPLHRRIISPPLRQSQEEVGVYIGLLYPKKKHWVEELQNSSSVSAGATATAMSRLHHQLSRPTLLFKLSFSGCSRGPGSIEWPSVQQQFRISAWETGRSCQHLINRTHPVLMTHKIWRNPPQENLQAVVHSMTHSTWTLTKALNMRRLPLTRVTVTWKAFYFELQSLDNKLIISSGQSKSWPHGNWSV